MKTLTSLFGLGLLLTVGLLFNVSTNANAGGHMAAKANIVDTAKSAGSFNTLLAALEATGLDETLQGKGPFTVFAPTDKAFEALGEETINSLLKDKKALSGILLYHVVAGEVPSSQVVSLNSATTVQGSDVSIKVKRGKVYVDKAKVVKTDIQTSNGVIHVIDAVLTP